MSQPEAVVSLLPVVVGSLGFGVEGVREVVAANEVTVSVELDFGSVVVKESEDHERLAKADGSEQSSGCDLVGEIQNLVHNCFSGEAIRGGWWKGRWWGKLQ